MQSKKKDPQQLMDDAVKQLAPWTRELLDDDDLKYFERKFRRFTDDEQEQDEGD